MGDMKSENISKKNVKLRFKDVSTLLITGSWEIKKKKHRNQLRNWYVYNHTEDTFKNKMITK